MQRLVATVHHLAVFPVKSLPGSAPRRVEVGADGLRGDRALVLVGPDGGTLTAKHHPGLRALDLTGPPEAPLVTAPGAAPGDLDAVARALGLAGPVRLERAAGGARQVAPVHVVTLAQRAAPGAEDSSRANVVLDLPAEPDDPDALTGALLRPEGADGPVLRLTGRPRHCAGVFADVLAPGVLEVGRRVLLEPGPAAPGDGRAPGPPRAHG
ncbi:MOSC N-terminal beta barrel domain-containing protein [Kineococcus sp. SYSU DK004]|uniref:MOSC N-terminal beta barrel domain-containing protein n=1 Tax=Kineococcus sp. SYSU DK004 TaxID=3383125 RepID=UPI003D7C7DFD